MIRYEQMQGVPNFNCYEYEGKKKEYCVLIPIINEGERIHKELKRALESQVTEYADIIICDGGSTDGCTEETKLRQSGVNTLLVKDDVGKQGAQLRMGFYFAALRGYKGVITIDGNNKDSIEDVPKFIAKLNKPNVKKLIGNANNLIIGLITTLTIVKIAAISMAYAKFSTLIPGR